MLNLPQIYGHNNQSKLNKKGSTEHSDDSNRNNKSDKGIRIGKKMSEPDELYTLRAQFCLGHYQMALDEAKGIMRRPMSPDLKAEREEIVARCYIAMKDYDKVISGDTSSKYTQYTANNVNNDGC